MTDNHDYNTPKEGATDWHVPLNENFEELDVDVEVRDVEANRSSYDPNAGAAFVETDTGIVYLGDGSSWVPTLSLGRFERGTEGDNESVNVVFGHPDNGADQGVVGATVSGGGVYQNAGGFMRSNRAGDHYATVGGGDWNEATGNASTVGGGRENRAKGKSSIVGGGDGNEAGDEYATVGGGVQNRAKTYTSTVGGGGANVAEGDSTTVAGGYSNEATGRQSTASGGFGNRARGGASAIGGGRGNDASGDDAFIGGGVASVASGRSATVAGGDENEAAGVWSMVPGGSKSEANGRGSFAAGWKAKADADGAFVWADASTQLVRSTVENEFKVQAGGGAVFYSKSDLSAGVSLAAGSGSWSSSSSREAKSDLRSVDSGTVLAGVRELDVSTWRYTAQDDGTKHMGPMAEDFHDAFGLGEDEQRISTVDADGVAFAAIQGLADRQDEQVLAIEELREENARLRRENEELGARLSALEEQVAADAGAN